MNGLRVVHHDLRVALRPEEGTLAATDTLFLAGEAAELSVYLGAGFTLTTAAQEGRSLSVEVVEEQKRLRRYRIAGWDPARMTVTLGWEGEVGEFQLSGVCAVCPRVVELSGFGAWFPTVMPSCYDERFTYRLVVDLPPDWDLVTPGISLDGDLRRRRREQRHPIEDIFVCATPRFDGSEAEVDGRLLRIYSSGLEPSVRDALVNDYVRSVQVMERHFGPMLPGRGGVAAVSPRSPQGEEWGYERGDLWVVGDAFVTEMVGNDWWPEYLPGPMSPSLHETIHSWFGLGLPFAQPWLVEAVTQYLQVVLSEEMFGRAGLAEAYFQSYVPRILASLADDDRPISELTLADNPYEQWYLKGSWAFWDLEAAVGRRALLETLAQVYRRHVPEVVDYHGFVRETCGLLRRPLEDHFGHWFSGRGFSPRWRTG
jgi:hypothetical protein